MSAIGNARDLVHGLVRLPVTRRLAIVAVVSITFLFMLNLHSGPSLPSTIYDNPYIKHRHDLPLELDPTQWSQRREVVREAFQHCYGAYERSAFGADELKPISNRTHQK